MAELTCGEYADAVRDAADRGLKRRERLATIAEVRQRVKPLYYINADQLKTHTLAVLDAMEKEARDG